MQLARDDLLVVLHRLEDLGGRDVGDGRQGTEARDEIYTTLRNNACYRFDLVINTFCGGEVSGVRDITPAELNAVLKRLQSILDTVGFDAK